MKALVFKRYGGGDHIAFADTPRPVPKPDEILVQVHAAGLNPIDNMIPKGMFKPILRFQLPATLGSDLAGVVVEVGNRVTRFKPGDRVMAILPYGGLAEMARLGQAMGANLETLTGLSGLGDLVLTCTGSLSRNRFVGEELGKGRTLDEIAAELEKFLAARRHGEDNGNETGDD